MGRKTRKATANAVTPEVLPEGVENAITGLKNSLSEALGYGGNSTVNGGQIYSGWPAGAGFPFNQNPWAPTISQATTLFENLRYYFVSNFRQTLSEAYVEIGLIQTIVNVPVDDALRGGVEIKSKQLDPEEVEELQISLDRDDDLGVAGMAAKWTRLFGGGGVIVMTDQDPEEPLDISAIGPDDKLDFRAADLWELTQGILNVDGFSPTDDLTEAEFYDYYGVKVHKSRVMRVTGLTAPSFLRPRLRGWGFSVVEALVRSINQYLKATDLAFEVLDEFKLDVYKIKNLTNTLISPTGTEKVRQRMQLAQWYKNYQNALVMDSEDDFDHKQLSFSGLKEAMDGIKTQVASDMRMPLTKLFGISAAGFNSGEDDIEVYNSMIESDVRAKIKYHILRMLELKCQKLFGYVPDDLTIAFKPLRVLSSEQEENVKKAKFDRLFQARTAGIVDDKFFQDCCNKGNLFDVQLETTDLLNPDGGNVAAEEGAAEDGALGSGGKAPKGKATAKDAPEAKDKPVTNALKPFTSSEKAQRLVKNSATFDRKSYEADGGDGQFDDRRQYFFEEPNGVDEALWSRAKRASQDAFGEVRWKFVAWFYQKIGGLYT